VLDAGTIAQIMRGVPKVELQQVESKVLASDVVVRLAKAPLELREVVVRGVRRRTVPWSVG
jgi:hypothetical protein